MPVKELTFDCMRHDRRFASGCRNIHLHGATGSYGPITSTCRLLADCSPHLLPPSLPRHKTQIVQADRRRLPPAGQPLQHLGGQIGEPQLPTDMALRQSHGLGQFLCQSELACPHAPQPRSRVTNRAQSSMETKLRRSWSGFVCSRSEQRHPKAA
jgi:hypothetical protein